MSENPTINTDDTVSFVSSPRWGNKVEAVVTGSYESGRGKFLTTRDANGVERNVRPGSCTVVKPAGKGSAKASKKAA